MHFNLIRKTLLISTVSLLANASALASQFPSQSIRMVVPYPAGGSTDIAARAVADAVSRRVGHPIVVDNRPGAGTAIGADIVARAKPDGYTVLFAATSVSLTPMISASSKFNFQRDLKPVSMVLEAPLVLLASPKLEVKDFANLLKALRSSPGVYNFGYPGMGSVNHLASIQLENEAKVKTTRIPYKGNAESLQGLMSGDIALAFDAIMSSKSLIESGRVGALAVSSKKRNAVLPNLPTMSEVGLPGFEAIFWNGVFAPAGTPAEVVTRLSTEIDAVLRTPEMLQKFRDLGAEPVGGPPAVFERQINADLKKWGQIIREGNIKSD